MPTRSTTKTAKPADRLGPILGFVLDPQGLMVDLSLKGAKFTRIQR